MFRISPDDSIPHHFEAVPMRTTPRVVGSLSAALIMIIGFSLAAMTRGLSAELLAPFVVIFGGLLAVAVVRCRRLEVTLGTKRLDLRSGPFRHTVPTGAIDASETRRATAWRRLFSEEEVVLQISVGSGALAIPSRKPAEFVQALAELR